MIEEIIKKILEVFGIDTPQPAYVPVTSYTEVQE